MDKCFFCERMKDKIRKSEYILENELALGIFDYKPVSSGHILIITKRHTPTFFETTNEERVAMFELIDKAKEMIDKKYKPDGYNIGINCGVDAGQTAMHVHIHLIPRYKGDVENPTGGVRGVIPEKQNY